ncbi:MAG: hypothetical protein WCK59_00400 [Candidatus Falkowbacteria bacterium]
MKNSEILVNLEKAFNATFKESSPNFFGSDLQSQAFGRILQEVTLSKNRTHYAFTDQNRGGSWATFICPCLPDGSIPVLDSLREGDKITVLLHWGMNYEFLDDLVTWGSRSAHPYKVAGVNYSVIEEFINEKQTNYCRLYYAIERFKTSGIWEVAKY